MNYRKKTVLLCTLALLLPLESFALSWKQLSTYSTMLLSTVAASCYLFEQKKSGTEEKKEHTPRKESKPLSKKMEKKLLNCLSHQKHFLQQKFPVCKNLFFTQDGNTFITDQDDYRVKEKENDTRKSNDIPEPTHSPYVPQTPNNSPNSSILLSLEGAGTLMTDQDGYEIKTSEKSHVIPHVAGGNGTVEHVPQTTSSIADNNTVIAIYTNDQRITKPANHTRSEFPLYRANKIQMLLLPQVMPVGTKKPTHKKSRPALFPTIHDNQQPSIAIQLSEQSKIKELKKTLEAAQKNNNALKNLFTSTMKSVFFTDLTQVKACLEELKLADQYVVTKSAMLGNSNKYTQINPKQREAKQNSNNILALEHYTQESTTRLESNIQVCNHETTLLKKLHQSIIKYAIFHTEQSASQYLKSLNYDTTYHTNPMRSAGSSVKFVTIEKNKKSQK